jgi:hypothetical protein
MPDLYRHFKGTVYEAVGVAEHTETGHHFMVYRDPQTGNIWARPLAMFTGYVWQDGGMVRRFERIRPDDGGPRQ